jgi:hypothetical protein
MYIFAVTTLILNVLYMFSYLKLVWKYCQWSVDPTVYHTLFQRKRPRRATNKKTCEMGGTVKKNTAGKSLEHLAEWLHLSVSCLLNQTHSPSTIHTLSLCCTFCPRNCITKMDAFRMKSIYEALNLSLNLNQLIFRTHINQFCDLWNKFKLNLFLICD